MGGWRDYETRYPEWHRRRLAVFLTNGFRTLTNASGIFLPPETDRGIRRFCQPAEVGSDHLEFGQAEVFRSAARRSTERLEQAGGNQNRYIVFPEAKIPSRLGERETRGWRDEIQEIFPILIHLSRLAFVKHSYRAALISSVAMA